MFTRKTVRGLTAFLLGTIFLGGCGPSIPVRFPQYPRSTGAQLKAVLEGKRTLGVIAAPANPNVLGSMGYEGDWSPTVEAAVTEAVEKKEYYDVVDISSRKDRLRELAYTQSGMTAESLAIGRELAVGSMLVVKLTRQPRTECKREADPSAADRMQARDGGGLSGLRRAAGPLGGFRRRR